MGKVFYPSLEPCYHMLIIILYIYQTVLGLEYVTHVTHD